MAIFLCSNHNQCLVLRLPSSNRCLFGAPVGLVYLYPARQPVPPRSHHGTPQLMEPGPCRVVAPQAQHPLQPDGAGTVLLTGHRPHGPKPQRQRFTRVLENGPGRHRALIPATGTLQQQPTNRPVPPLPTTRAAKPIRPTQPQQVLAARVFCRNARLKFSQSPGIILHGISYYMLGVPESSRYPTWAILRPLSRNSIGAVQAGI